MFLKIFSFILISSLVHVSLYPLFAVDTYYNFPEVSIKGEATFEKKRKICVFPLRTSQKDPKFQYLSKGIPSVLVSELRTLEFIYVEYPHQEVIYHSFGKNPQYSMQELVDKKGEGIKRKKKEISSEADLEDLRKGKKSVSPSQDPRYVKVELKLLTEIKPPFAEDIYAHAAKYECDYSLTGDFAASESKLNVNIELFDVYEGKVQKFSEETSFIRAYQELTPLGERIRFALQGKETTLVQVEAQGLDSCLVYLDGIYLGKTPVTSKKFPIGKRELFVFKEGYFPYKQSVILEQGKTFYLDVKLVKIENTSFLSVKTVEEGADVFLGVTYLGKTPLEKVSIPAGANRLRVSKQGFVDAFRPVNAKPGENSIFEIQLREGKSEIYYPNKQYVFLDYSYKDFATYSLYGSLFFYASYLYLNVASRRAYEDSRSQINLVNATSIVNFYNGNTTNEFLGWYFYQTQLIEAAESKAQTLKHMAGTLPTENRRDRKLVGGPMVYGMGFMLLAAATFFWLGLDEESYDIGFLPYTPQGGAGNQQLPNGKSNLDSYSYIQYNYRF
ncbi:PEGA domain-containing protein [Leptospira ognonensis]|uniref:PEGA domain-containing protein n=1 Tax=Leptospira ognonensis TaxID=2484945 RepID=A0A4R9K231_9LEPT|nr:PEGA domain-containing protein [Leptospira ognonensis]TGL60043.1 PEGA domain-containing protein [Leptospira ognonensis]